MKKNQFIFYLATIISGMLSVASCSDEDGAVATGKQASLEIQVSGVQSTRSIIEGNKLPEECQYGIFALEGSSGDAALSDGINARVDYIKGISTLSRNIYLPNDVNSTIYAYYPFNEAYNGTDFLTGAMRIEANSQTDYLYGYSADNENRLTYVNANQPKAKIYFKHALARVTIRIKKATDNENTYKFPYINLLNVDKNAYINVLKGGAILDPSGTANLTAKPSDYALENSDNEIVADFLVIPGNTEGKKIILNMSDNISSFENGLSAAVPVTNWEAGQQYTYMVTVKKNNLEISQAEIIPWENNEQGGIELGDDNYIMAVGGSIANAVDLGLSVKWASWNVGAASPEEYGGLYGWADPTGKKISMDVADYNIRTDILGTEYDIARIQWGVNWRLPSAEELEELRTNCSWTWTTQNDIIGYKITGTNGNAIFLPASGWREGTELFNRDHSGGYLSGTWNTGNRLPAHLTFHDNYYTEIVCTSLYYGFSVRPVTEK